MASFSRDVKNEISRVFDEDEECLRAELFALLNVGSIFVDGQIIFSTPNAAVARKVINLLKKVYPDAKREFAAVRKKVLMQSTRYVVRIFLTGEIEKIANDFESPEIVEDDFAKVSYLRGVFLSRGTVNRPEKKYYLDISVLSESAAIFINQIWQQLDFNPTFFTRKEFFVNCITEGDAVSEFLGMIGAEETLERFEVTRNLKEVRANVNRLVNVETANLNRAIEAAQRQLADVNYLQENNVKVSKELKLAMKARLLFPECSVSELAEKLFITKQGLNKRFNKIHEIALKTKRQIELKKQLGINS